MSSGGCADRSGCQQILHSVMPWLAAREGLPVISVVICEYTQAMWEHTCLVIMGYIWLYNTAVRNSSGADDTKQHLLLAATNIVYMLVICYAEYLTRVWREAHEQLWVPTHSDGWPVQTISISSLILLPQYGQYCHTDILWPVWLGSYTQASCENTSA